jgi:hypothetical protein
MGRRAQEKGKLIALAAPETGEYQRSPDPRAGPGVVKVLDFGLAKTIEEPPAVDRSDSRLEQFRPRGLG